MSGKKMQRSTEFAKICRRRGLSIEAAAELFEVNPRTIRNWIDKGAPKLVMRLLWGMEGRLECLDPRWKGFKIGLDGKLRGPNGFRATPQYLGQWRAILRCPSCYALPPDLPTDTGSLPV